MNMMREHGIRHLPILDAGGLVGIVSDRDVKFASSFGDSTFMTVADIMTQDPYVVAPEASLDQVVFEMAEHKYGSAIVRQKNGKVVGVFTATDGMRVLGEILQANYKKAVS
jgi:acetoin utilization protein AcuB